MTLRATQALAIRRAAFTSAVLVATLSAHRVQDDSLRLSLGSLPVLLSIICAATLLGARRAAFRPRRAPAILVSLVAAQAALHLAMSAAPWAFGLTLHHAPVLVSATALVAHAVAALVLTGALLWTERTLTAALTVVRMLRRMLRDGRTSPGLTAVAPLPDLLLAHAAFAPATPSRGPPL